MSEEPNAGRNVNKEECVRRLLDLELITVWNASKGEVETGG